MTESTIPRTIVPGTPSYLLIVVYFEVLYFVWYLCSCITCTKYLFKCRLVAYICVHLFFLALCVLVTTSYQRHPGMRSSHTWIINHSRHPQLQQIGDENGDSPGRYRPARCGTPNLRFVESAPLGEDMAQSSAHKYCHVSTTPMNPGRKRLSPGSIPPRTV